MKVLPSSSPTTTAGGPHVGGNAPPSRTLRRHLTKGGPWQTRRTMCVSRGPVLCERGTTASKTLTLASKVSPKVCNLPKKNNRFFSIIILKITNSMRLLYLK